MISCADLDRFFDGELTKDDAANFREHLVECPRCQAALRGRMQEETALEKWLDGGAQHPAGATPAPGVRPVVVGNPEHEGFAGCAGDPVEQALDEDGDPAVARVVACELGGQRGAGGSRMLIYLAPALAAAAAVAIWLMGIRGDPATSAVGSGAARLSSPIEFSLAIERRGVGTRSGAVAAGEGRGSVAQVGDILRSTVHGEGHRAIWVYLEDRELVTACPDGPGCRNAGGGLALELRLSAPGRYSLLAISSAQPILTPHGPLDGILGSIASMGAHFEIKRVDVN
jgi:anti-sigma factor RsiW